MEPQAPLESIQPQPGPQTDFLSTEADIGIYGGSAGGGKTFGLLLEGGRNQGNPLFNAVIFRRNSVQVRNPGGLWDESVKVYPRFGAIPKESALEWVFSSGAEMKFSHLEYDKDVLNWQGSQICLIGFDELTHFSEYQFFYMLSRNRSTCGVRPYIRATTNPDATSWVRKFIDWWIGPDGLPIPERAGVLRWFIRIADKIIWADSPEEIWAKYGRKPEIQPKSVTFIPSTIYDNAVLMEKDPGYLANLLALPRVERERLLGGNWNVRAQAGTVFKREWFEIIDAVPASVIRSVRYWDKAATEVSESNPDPDWTRGAKLFRLKSGIFVLADMKGIRATPLKVEALVKNTASQDGWEIPICIEQDPGSAGVADAENYARLLSGYNVRLRKPTKDKLTRALPASAQAEAGNIKLLRGAWNEDFLTEAENFSGDGDGHDDQIDAFSGAFNELHENASLFDVY